MSGAHKVQVRYSNVETSKRAYTQCPRFHYNNSVYIHLYCLLNITLVLFGIRDTYIYSQCITVQSLSDVSKTVWGNSFPVILPFFSNFIDEESCSGAA